MIEDLEIIRCRICLAITRRNGTQLCDRCWELEHRITLDPEIARKILADFDAKKERDKLRREA